MDVRVTEILQLIAVTVAAIGLWFNLLQQKKSNNLKRLEIVSDMIGKIHDNSKTCDFFYYVESEEFNFDESVFHGSENERNLDRILYIFDMIANQYYLGHIKKRDLDLFVYEYSVFYRNVEIKKYFEYLDRWFSDKGIKDPPFSRFRKLADEMFR